MCSGTFSQIAAQNWYAVSDLMTSGTFCYIILNLISVRNVPRVNFDVFMSVFVQSLNSCQKFLTTNETDAQKLCSVTKNNFLNE